MACVVVIVPGLANPCAAQAPDTCDGYMPGDANGDEIVNVGDAVYLITYIFRGGPPPYPYEIYSGDANCDCEVTVADPVYLIQRVFQFGPPPCDCEEWMDRCR